MSVDETRQHVLSLFSTAVRACQARGDVSIQKLNFGLAQLLNQSDQDSIINLEPLMTYMVETGLEPRAVRDILVFFHSKSGATGIEFALPPALYVLDDAVRADIIDRMARNTTDAVQAKMERPKAPVPGAPPPARRASAPHEKARSPGSTSPVMIGVFALVLIAGLATYFVYLKPGPDAPNELTLTPEQNKIGCEVIKSKGDVTVCIVGVEAAKARTDEQFKADAAVTHKVLVDRGFTTARIVSPDGRQYP